MQSLKRLTHQASSSTRATLLGAQLSSHQDKLFLHPTRQHLAQRSSIRFLDIYQLGNKAAIEKERARLADEMNRGYFADISELNQHGGKIAMANKIIIPAMAAIKFPALEVNYSDGTTVKLPKTSNGDIVDVDKLAIPKASLLCLSFRANSQAMIDSWSGPFIDAFSNSKDVRLYEVDDEVFGSELTWCVPYIPVKNCVYASWLAHSRYNAKVSFIDSWFLRLNPIKRLLLRIMKKSNGGKDALQKQIVYSFGDHYYFRKELKVLNLLTGYIFLLDKFGRIRWQGFGLATQEELSSLLSCTSLLLEEK